MIKVACQTPQEHCGAALTEVNNNLLGQGRSRKLHASHEQAFACYASYLQGIGYTRVGSREFRAPDGGILVLTKKTRYGATFRTGKTASGGKTTKRFVPKVGRLSSNGIIIS